MKTRAPMGWLYASAGALRRRAHDLGLLPTHRVSVPVISVGALAPGGSGKTPVTRLLAELLEARGLRVGVITSGYRGARRGAVCRVDLSAGAALAARDHGDEAALLARWLPRAVVVCGRDRVAAARRAVDQGAQVLVVDDGFQHRRLERDLDLLMVDEPRGWLLREPASAERFAHLIWCHRRDGGDGNADRGARSAEELETKVWSRNVPRSLLNMDGGEVGRSSDLRGKRVFLLAGVARPDAFEALVRHLGARVVGRIFVGDHRALRPRHLRRASRARPDLLLCTEKDAVKLAGPHVGPDLLALACDVELTSGRELLDQALEKII